MDQFRGARVRIESGIATVRQVWRGNIGVQVGAFTAEETVTWASAAGTGKYVSDNGAQIAFYRTSGALPVVGDTILGSSSGATATIASFPAESLKLTTPVASYPANFETTGGTQGAIATNDELFIESQTPARVGGTIGSDSFELSAAWGGSTLTDVECVINRERTSIHGVPLAKQGSRLAFAIIEEAFRTIDPLLGGGGGGGGGSDPPTAFSNFTMTNNWSNVAGRAAAAHSYESATDTVRLKGYINRSSGNATNGEDIVAANGLPSGRRPSERLDFTHEGERFSVRTDGSIKYDGVSGAPPGPISLNQVTFRANGS